MGGGEELSSSSSTDTSVLWAVPIVLRRVYVQWRMRATKIPESDLPHFEGAMAGKSRQVWGENDKLGSVLRGWQASRG